MSIGIWLDRFVDLMVVIMSNPMNSLIMGTVSGLVATIALVFNHYTWRRALILTLMSISGGFGFYILKVISIGPDNLDNTQAFMIIVLMFLMTLFMIIGFWIALFVKTWWELDRRKRIISNFMREQANKIPHINNKYYDWLYTKILWSADLLESTIDTPALSIKERELKELILELMRNHYML
jgi:hypothetical protein